MNLNVSGGGMQGLAILAVIAAVFSAIFWMVVGWRAMRAHERLADGMEEVTRLLRAQEPRVADVLEQVGRKLR